jgi:hypothetical protein
MTVYSIQSIRQCLVGEIFSGSSDTNHGSFLQNITYSTQEIKQSVLYLVDTPEQYDLQNSSHHIPLPSEQLSPLVYVTEYSSM